MNTIILSALQKQASDIHVEATEQSMEVKYRIDGVLYSAMEPLANSLHSSFISRLKIMAELDIAERRIPQMGDLSFALITDGRLSCSILPSVFGEAVVIRILDKQNIASGVQGLRLDILGYDPDDLRPFVGPLPGLMEWF